MFLLQKKVATLSSVTLNFTKKYQLYFTETLFNLCQGTSINSLPSIEKQVLFSSKHNTCEPNRHTAGVIDTST